MSDVIAASVRCSGISTTFSGWQPSGGVALVLLSGTVYATLVLCTIACLGSLHGWESSALPFTPLTKTPAPEIAITSLDWTKCSRSAKLSVVVGRGVQLGDFHSQLTLQLQQKSFSERTQKRLVIKCLMDV